MSDTAADTGLAVEDLHAHLLKKPGTTAEQPFSPDSLVFKVAGKMFALIAIEAEPRRVSFKAPPELNEELRRQWPTIEGAYHMNKKHWSMVDLDGSVPRDLVLDLVDGSYDLVVASLTKKVRATLVDSTDSDSEGGSK